MATISLVLIFVGGAFAGIFAKSGNKLSAFLITLAVFILMLGVIKSMNDKVDELVIKKLCYIYAFMDMMPESVVAKQIRRVLKEIALDTCGVGYYNIWLKWEAYFKKELQNKMEDK